MSEPDAILMKVTSIRKSLRGNQGLIETVNVTAFVRSSTLFELEHSELLRWLQLI